MTYSLKLSELEGAAVQSVLDRLSARAGYRLTLNNLFNQWSCFVADIARGYGDNIYEYTNTLAVRDLLEEVCSSSPTPAREAIERVLRPIDDRYEMATTYWTFR